MKKKAAAPTASTRAEFETLRTARKEELMRTLGLSPMPPRTPLNARVTGVFQRKGYRVENVVLESRPRFYVTAQIYIPDGPAGARYPVIMNPHGHWVTRNRRRRCRRAASSRRCTDTWQSLRTRRVGALKAARKSNGGKKATTTISNWCKVERTPRDITFGISCAFSITLRHGRRPT